MYNIYVMLCSCSRLKLAVAHAIQGSPFRSTATFDNLLCVCGVVLQAAQGRRAIEKTRPERAIWQDGRVFSSGLVPEGSLGVPRPPSGRKISSKRTGPQRKKSCQKINLLGHCRITYFFETKTCKNHFIRQWPSKLIFWHEFFRWEKKT